MRCRYGDLLLAAALLAGEDQEYLRCDEAPEHKAIAAIDDEGFVLEFTTPVCPTHEAILSQMPDHKRSIKLRSRPDSATASLAADS